MRQISPRSLFFVGFMLIATPMVIQAINSVHDKQRSDTFYRVHSLNATLPEALEPSGFAGYHWACFGIGVSLLFTGIRESRVASSVMPEAWENAEV